MSVKIYFEKRFADDVEYDLKNSTLRRTKKCNPGDVLELCQENERGETVVLKEAVCTSVAFVEIDYAGITVDGKRLYCGWAKKDDYRLDFDCDFAKADGFEDFQDMAEYFRQNYGLPYAGFLIKWK